MNTQLHQLASIARAISSTTMPSNAQQCLKCRCSSNPDKCGSKAQGHKKPEYCTHYLQKLLVSFDSMFKAHRLEYFLTAGTLLGAVRDQGHIPWTANVDVAPTTSSFVKLLTLKGGINEAAKRHGLHFFFYSDIVRGCLLDPVTDNMLERCNHVSFDSIKKSIIRCPHLQDLCLYDTIFVRDEDGEFPET